MTEIWKVIPNFGNYYEVSNKGRVRNCYGKILKPYVNIGGYLAIKLKLDKYYTHTIHRLVASLFIGKLSTKVQVDHINGDKHNNCVDNLRIVTPSQNQKYLSERLNERRLNKRRKD